MFTPERLAKMQGKRILRVEGRRVLGYQYEPLPQPLVPLIPQDASKVY